MYNVMLVDEEYHQQVYHNNKGTADFSVGQTLTERDGILTH